LLYLCGGYIWIVVVVDLYGFMCYLWIVDAISMHIYFSLYYCREKEMFCINFILFSNVFKE